MVSANLVRMINPYGDEHLVMFQIDYKAQWHIAELIPFAMLGIMGVNVVLLTHLQLSQSVSLSLYWAGL